jgi:hypothetical protein
MSTMISSMPQYQQNLQLFMQPPNFYSAVDSSDLATKIGQPLKQMSRPMPNPPRSESVDSEDSKSSPKAKNRLYKTELCRSFIEHRRCPYGERCQYALGEVDVREVPRHPKFKTELCRTFHNTGYCPYGPRCHFVHSNSSSIQQSQPTTTATPHLSLSLTMPNLHSLSGDETYSSSSIGSDSPTSSYSPGLTDDESAFCSPIGPSPPTFSWSAMPYDIYNPFPNQTPTTTTNESNMVDLITEGLNRLSSMPQPAPVRRLPVFTRLSNGE